MLFDPSWQSSITSTMVQSTMEVPAMSCGNGAKFCGNGAINCAIDIDGLIRFATFHFPVATAANLAAVSGATVSTAEKWLRGETLPSGTFLAAMIAAFGPSFVAACVPGAKAWAEQAARDERIKQLDAEKERLLAAE